MPKFGKKSIERLETCHPELQRLFNDVIKEYDCTVLCGERGEEAQDKAYANGASKVQWPMSKHNTQDGKLSIAIDIGPYPLDWTDFNRWYHFGGYVMRTASCMGVSLRWGGDWDGDLNFKDQNFNDLPHFELLED